MTWQQPSASTSEIAPGSPVSLEEIRSDVMARIADLDDGDPLDQLTAALINLAVHVSVTALDPAGTELSIGKALDLGATSVQIHEAMVLVSGLGVHSLMEGSPRLMRQLRMRNPGALTGALDANQLALKARYIGDDPYWEPMEREVPGFLDSLLRLSPEAFEGFFQYCSLPWKSGALRALTKELMAFASDATWTHRFMPGLRLHLGNAVKLGAGRIAILQALDIAAAAPIHNGIR